VKKLLLIPTVVVTAFLALAFLMPATAASVIRSVAPSAQISLASAVSTRSETVAAAPATKVTSQSASETSFQGSTSQLLVSSQTVHGVSTGGEMNCGRFGNGFHGGKHDFICPNRPFPQPPNP
jgi:hypothetical protein